MNRFFSGSGLLIAAILVAGCSGTNAAPAKAASLAVKPAMAMADAVPLSRDEIIASGPLVVENQVEVAAQRDGMVSRISVETGARVQKGQLLGELDDHQALADRDAAAARVRSLEFDVKGWEYETKVLQSDLDRAEKMWESQLITKQDLDHVRYKVEADKFETERYRANLESAREQLKSAQFELAKTRITAPFSGVVGRRYVRMGDKVTSGTKLFWITATSPLNVRFTLPEKYVGKIRKGDMLSLNVGGSPEMKHAAKVMLVSPVVDAASGTIEVSAQVIPPVADLRPGMSADISLNRPK